MIMKGRAPLRLSRAGLLTLGAMAIATLPTWAAGTQQPATTAAVAQATTAAQATREQKPRPAATATTKAEPASKAATAQKAEHPRVTDVRVEPTHAVVVRETRPATAHVVEEVSVARAAVAQQATTARKADVRAVHVSNEKAEQMWVHLVANLPEDGEKLLKGFEADRASIQADADAKVVARRTALLKALEDLQAAYAKAGKLDEAVAIRDYLRAGGPQQGAVWIKR